MQLSLLLECLAGLTPIVRAPFAAYLLSEAPTLAYGSTLMVVTALTPPSILEALLQLRAHGRRARLISLAEDRPAVPAWDPDPASERGRGSRGMNRSAQSTEWAREILAGQVLWRPLGVTFALWAWFGWLTPWFTALLPYGREARVPQSGDLHPGCRVARSLERGRRDDDGHAENDGGSLAADRSSGRTLAVGWWAYVAAPLGGAGSHCGPERDANGRRPGSSS